MISLTLLFAQITGDPVTDLLDITDDNIEAVQQSFNDLWDSVLHGNMFFQLMQIGAAIALIFFGWHMLKMLTIAHEGGDPFRSHHLSDIILAVIIVLLIALPSPTEANPNQYQDTLLITSLSQMRTVTNQITASVRDGLYGDVDKFKSNPIKEARVKAQAQILFSQQLRDCLTLTEVQERSNCFTDIQNSLIEFVKPYDNGYNSWPALFIRDYVDKTVETIRGKEINFAQLVSSALYDIASGFGGIARPAFTTLIIGVLYAWSAAFEWGLEFAALGTATIAPIYLGLSLVPSTTRMIYVWITSFFSIFMAKLGFTIVVGFVSYLMLDNLRSNPLIGAFAIALGAPIFALALAGGGGIALYLGIASLGNAVFSRAGRR